MGACKLSSLRRGCLTVVLTSFLLPIQSFAESRAMRDGKEVILKDNGTWEYVKTDTAYDFVNLSSSTLVAKAFEALGRHNWDAAIAYSRKCADLYEEQARAMQANLKDYPSGKDEVLSYWALNDVGTAYYVLGEAYRQTGKKTEAVASFQMLVNHYSFAQCWDPQGWFWKPAEVAQEKLKELETAEAAK